MPDRRPRRSGSSTPAAIAGVASCLLVACSAASYAADADREVYRALQEATTSSLGDRERTVLRPEAEPLPATPSTDPQKAVPEPSLPGKPPEHFDLRRALATAVRDNRDMLSRREGLYRSGLSISLTRFQFGPQFAAAVDYLWPRNEAGAESHQAGGSLSASQILPTGGSIALSSGIDASWPIVPGPDVASYGTSAGVTITQPLLRGFGHAVAWEGLIQAERDLIYAVRDFELFREDFSIRIAQQFFELSSQKKTLANEDANYDAAVFDRKKAEALLQVGRNTEKEVFLARRREITAKDQLINARADYDRAVDSFKIVLGLPTTTAIELADDEPPFVPVRYEASSAIAAARQNRLDLMTERQRLEDAERSLYIVENALLPDLSLTASFGLGGAGDDLGRAAPDEWNSAVGVAFEIPLQRKAQRNNLRATQIGVEQTRRSLQLIEDQLDQSIRESLRRLRSVEERIALQEGQIEQERAAVTVMEIRYESGQVDNRELLEARQALVDARNARIRLKVEHFIGRLNLLKDMGLFFVDEQGMWR
jgi:outer membrane protein TolC